MIPVHVLHKEEIKEIKVVELPLLKQLPLSEAHRHQFYECFVFLKGGGIHTIDFVDFPINDFSVHIITPGQVHQISREKNSYGYVYMFDLAHFSHDKNIEDFLFDHACFDVKEFSPLYHFDESFNATLTGLSGQIWKDSHSTGALRNKLMINQISLLMLYCMQHTISKTGNNDAKHSDVYTAFRRLLNVNYTTMKKVKDYAQQLNITEKLLNEIILQRTGENVSSLIFKQLILEAKRLLNSGYTAKQVAYQLNFTDPAHFSKFFKTQTGFSPSEFT
ncbi:MAG: helix-turn-helix domain-containing protein [Bacteroidota bacterium]|jgi:AraC-like DNA-binding protein/mannose-6-phosphate isomerase-like protein (cupin superfamily)